MVRIPPVATLGLSPTTVTQGQTLRRTGFLVTTTAQHPHTGHTEHLRPPTVDPLRFVVTTPFPTPQIALELVRDIAAFFVGSAEPLKSERFTQFEWIYSKVKYRDTIRGHENTPLSQDHSL